jgi:hypothetical protein
MADATHVDVYTVRMGDLIAVKADNTLRRYTPAKFADYVQHAADTVAKKALLAVKYLFSAIMLRDYIDWAEVTDQFRKELFKCTNVTAVYAWLHKPSMIMNASETLVAVFLQKGELNYAPEYVGGPSERTATRKTFTLRHGLSASAKQFPSPDPLKDFLVFLPFEPFEEADADSWKSYAFTIPNTVHFTQVSRDAVCMNSSVMLYFADEALCARARDPKFRPVSKELEFVYYAGRVRLGEHDVYAILTPYYGHPSPRDPNVAVRVEEGRGQIRTRIRTWERRVKHGRSRRGSSESSSDDSGNVAAAGSGRMASKSHSPLASNHDRQPGPKRQVTFLLPKERDDETRAAPSGSSAATANAVQPLASLATPTSHAAGAQSSTLLSPPASASQGAASAPRSERRFGPTTVQSRAQTQTSDASGDSSWVRRSGIGVSSSNAQGTQPQQPQIYTRTVHDAGVPPAPSAGADSAARSVPRMSYGQTGVSQPIGLAAALSSLRSFHASRPTEVAHVALETPQASSVPLQAPRTTSAVDISMPSALRYIRSRSDSQLSIDDNIVDLRSLSSSGKGYSLFGSDLQYKFGQFANRRLGSFKINNNIISFTFTFATDRKPYEKILFLLLIAASLAQQSLEAEYTVQDKDIISQIPELKQPKKPEEIWRLCNSYLNVHEHDIKDIRERQRRQSPIYGL